MNDPRDELELLRELRRLPRERDPARELWPGIEARIGAARAAAPGKRLPRLLGFALAATLAMAAIFALRPVVVPLPAPVAESTPKALPSRQAEVPRRAADALALEYELALQPYASAGLPPELRAAATELDLSAQQLRRALREQPEATYLLDRLRHTYDQRLKLTQRGLLG